jgi:hypothetical protein
MKKKETLEKKNSMCGELSSKEFLTFAERKKNPAETLPAKVFPRVNSPVLRIFWWKIMIVIRKMIR